MPSGSGEVPSWRCFGGLPRGSLLAAAADEDDDDDAIAGPAASPSSGPVGSSWGPTGGGPEMERERERERLEAPAAVANLTVNASQSQTQQLLRRGVALVGRPGVGVPCGAAQPGFLSPATTTRAGQG